MAHRHWNERRGGDSNPRYGFPYTAFPVLHNRPLCHLSGPPLDRGDCPSTTSAKRSATIVRRNDRLDKMVAATRTLRDRPTGNVAAVSQRERRSSSWTNCRWRHRIIQAAAGKKTLANNLTTSLNHERRSTLKSGPVPTSTATALSRAAPGRTRVAFGGRAAPGTL